jgi:NTP pyrophosphatase (non-canonical NTP hydrolase)
MSDLTIPIPPEVEPYKDDIRRFVHAMIYKLKIHHKKGRWEDKTMAEYFPLLSGECGELNEAIADGNLLEILTEAADCANMALIIASIATERGQ